MNGSYFLMNITRFCLLLFLQIVVFCRIDFLGIVAFPYILFLILYPVNANRYGFLFASFLLGITMDMFLDSGGVHTASCLIIAFFRNYIFKISFGLSFQYQIIKISASSLREQFIFVGLMTVIHHMIMFFLETFTIDLFVENILKIVCSIILTVIFNLLIINLFKSSDR